MNNDITTPLSLKQPAPVKLSPLCRLQEDTRRHTADKGGLSMQPSFSVTLEPGLERGVPWGCDLYTFVTSAAGHMMRTLHKPRKNRQSKRQVNHRRFLHNMIQRKFADIEAANHQLVSALYFKEERKNVSSLPSQEPETLNQSGSPSRGGYLQDPAKCSVHTGADGISKSRSDICVGSHEKKQSDSEHLLNQQPKSQPTTWTTRKNNQSNTGQKKESQNHKLVEFSSIISPMDHLHGAQLVHTEYYNDEGQLESANSFSEDSKTAQRDSGFIQIGQNMDTSPVFSPGLCPLSLDSCDFSIQTFTDISTCTQAQKNITDISEGQWSDIMDLFSIGNKDEGAFMDVEANFESICACQGDGGADTIGFADQSESVTEKICSKSSEMEDLHCEAGEYGYEYGHSCHGVQGVTTNHFQSALRQREDTTEIEFDNFKISQGIIQNQLPTFTSCHYNVSELQTHQQPQEESPCMLMNNQNFTPFDGVAQSFSVPLLNPEHRPIPTPPREDDWLFTDILQDRTSPDRKIPPIMF